MNIINHHNTNKRKRLDEIIQANSKDNWWKPKLFQDKVLPFLPKELEILVIPPSKNKNYNCFIYALGLNKDAEIMKDSKGFVYSAFFQKLIDENLAVYTDEPKDGDYVLYRNPEDHPDLITHLGILDKNKIISKWAWGPLVKHDLWSVPASYGKNISYIKSIDQENAGKFYWKYKNFNKVS